MKKIYYCQSKISDNLGVCAYYGFKSGDNILNFGGDIVYDGDDIDWSHALEIGRKNNTRIYLGPSGSIDDYVNHSCNPNCAVKVGNLKASLYAIKDIAPGEELTFDYSSTCTEDDYEMNCNCKSYNCRKIISSFNKLSEKDKERLKKLGTYPDW